MIVFHFVAEPKFSSLRGWSKVPVSLKRENRSSISKERVYFGLFCFLIASNNLHPELKRRKLGEVRSK